MMIQAVLGNPHHPEYGVATIPFPIPRDQYAHCMKLLEALEIGDAVKADCQVQEINSFYSVLKRTEMLTVNALSELLGHSSVNITLNRYVHSSMDTKKTNMQRLTL